ncbi:MAG: DUF4845 domain-containing protein [Moraxella sp.]|nr:DUF4845 domain-containing protein [Moraxella sp.]
MKHTSLNNQRGASVTGIVLLIICLGLLGKLSVGILPDYIENRQITKILANEVQKANESKLTEKQLMDNFARQLGLNGNYSGDFVKNSVITTNKTPGNLTVRLEYETNYQYYGNTYIVNRFSQDITGADAK